MSEACANAANRYGQASRLYLRIAANAGRSYLAESSFTAPLKVLEPFYDTQGRMLLTLITVSAATMAGDVQDIELELAADASARISSQAFEKLHAMPAGSQASRRITARIGSGATLDYSPLPTIPFADSAFVGSLHFELADTTSRLFYSDILAAGRIAAGERFAMRRWCNCVELYQQGRLAWMDNLVLEPIPASVSEPESASRPVSKPTSASRPESEPASVSEPASKPASKPAAKPAAKSEPASAPPASRPPGHPDSPACFAGYSHLGSALLANFAPDGGAEAQLAALTNSFDGYAGFSRTAAGYLSIKSLAHGSEPILSLHQQLRELLV
ncbi:MAG: urease accessory protein UreD [Coriobacteriales bacterium]|jgi:urease accessory protein UreH|nr:urease accessory protein UreD [Coriobacteriales bacterium]